jgi:aryl-alcohol dehydrogenase-like predicted oxidoreductase
VVRVAAIFSSKFPHFLIRYCLSAPWIEQQLTQTLARLNLETLDVYLLHNPEHYLQPAKSLQQFDACLEEAFTCLEKEVARGRIQFYGVSSNAWSRDNIDIDRMMNIAKKGKYFPSWLIAD